MSDEIAQCPYCVKSIHIRTLGGMSGVLALRCKFCGAPALISVYDYRLEEIRMFEADESAALAVLPKNLEPCPCGGHFAVNMPPRCPHCLKVISDKQLRELANLPLSSIYYHPFFMLKPVVNVKWVKNYEL